MSWHSWGFKIKLSSTHALKSKPAEPSVEYSGKGIGQRLTQQCLEKAIDNQEEIVALHTAEMMENARHIYSKLGFSIAKELPSNFGTRYWLYTLHLSNKKWKKQ